MARHRPLAHLFDAGRALPPGAGGRVREAVDRLKGDKRGAAAVVATMAMVPLLGVSALAVDVGGTYLLRRNMQAAVDAAAMAGAANLDTNPAATAEEVARSVAARNGFINGTAGTTVTVASAMVAVPGNPDPVPQVTVTAQRPARSRLFGAALRAAGQSGTEEWTVSASAVAQMRDAGPKNCVEARVGSVSVGNNTDISAPDCAIASNSAQSDAVKLGSGGSVGNGSGKITAANIVAHGGCTGCTEKAQNGNLTLTRSSAATTNTRPLRNPYPELENWSPPSAPLASCQDMPASKKGGVTLSAGCYTSISVKNNGPVNLQPGVYYIRGGDLNVQGTLTCTSCTDSKGVSIVLVGNNNSDPGKVDINAQASIDLNASQQSSEPALDGVLLYRHAPNAQASQNGKGEIDINGGANVRLDGAIVAPTSWVTMGGNAATDPKSCNIFVVHSIEFSGGSSLSAEGCHLYGAAASAPRVPRLVQ